MSPFESDYTWEPIEYTTDDGYVLTAFIVAKGKSEDMPFPPVIVQHGNGWDAASWVQELQTGGDPFMFKIVDKGFPVWLVN